MTQPDPVFLAFCSAGLWPGLGRTLAQELAESGITGPDDVTSAALATAIFRVSHT